MNETQLRQSIDETSDAIQGAAALAAAGAPLPTDLHLRLIDFHATVTNALAVAEGSTPRRVLSDWFKVAPADEDWRATTFAAMKARGEEKIGRGMGYRRDE